MSLTARLGRLGAPRLRDPWRTAARNQLRGQEGAFAIGALGLRLPEGLDELVAGLLAALRAEPSARKRLAWVGQVPRVVDHAPADVLVLGEHGPRLHPDPAVALPALGPARRQGLDAVLLVEAAALAEVPAERRGALLQARMGAAGGNRAGRAYARRLLGATVLRVERAPDRLELPPQRPLLPMAGNLLEVLVQRPGRLWVRANHVGIDGAPVQDVLGRLEGAWGSEPPVLPGPAPLAAAEPVLCAQRDGDGAAVAVLGLVDLAPVFALRAAARAPLPFAAAVAWALAAHPGLAETIAVPVDLPADGRRPRSTSLAVTSPAAYGGGPGGLAAYAAAFRDELAAARAGTNAVAAALRGAALVPTSLLVRVPVTPGGRAAVAGTAGVSVLAASDVFVPALNDAYRWYVGIGRARLATAAGGQVGAVVLKCRRADLPRLARALDEALAAPAPRR